MDRQIDFVDYDASFLEKSWEWLNNPVIKSMTNTPDFTKDNQLAWFQSLQFKTDYFIKGIRFNNIAVGAVGLKNITTSDAEYWGYIGDSEYWGKGIGSEMLSFAIEKGKEKKLKKLYLKVVESNTRALNLYKKFCFKQRDGENDLVYMELDLI